jgi:gas vesicle protein
MTDHRYSYLVLGMGLGAAAGLLLARESGTRTRRLLLKRAEWTRNRIHQQATEVCDDVAQRIQRGKQALESAAEGVAEAFETGKKALAR